MIGLIDYGMGNLRSVEKAIQRIGGDVYRIESAEDWGEPELLIVPGVGAFDRAVLNLREADLWQPVRDHLTSGGAYLGICLGLQLLFETSEEGDEEGFSLYEGTVRRFRDVEPVPHMGWNDVEWTGDSRALAPDGVDTPSYYFTHSFYVEPTDESLVAGRTEYGDRFCSALADGSRVGVQFHPEKSQFAGLDLLSRLIPTY